MYKFSSTLVFNCFIYNMKLMAIARIQNHNEFSPIYHTKQSEVYKIINAWTLKRASHYLPHIQEQSCFRHYR